MDNTRVLVFGYGELGVAAIETLSTVGAQVLGLVLPSNRAGLDVETARAFCAERSLPVLLQPPRSRCEPFIEQLRSLAPDLILVCSYSMILPPSILEIPRAGCVNLHGGLLPEYRGAHVMQWAIINGERETGMTLHYMDEGVDTGPVIAEERFPIEWEDDAASIRGKLKDAGIRLIKEYWRAISSGTAPRIPQDESRARHYRLRTPEDGLIDWSRTSTEIYNLVRALVHPWPGAFTFLRGRKIVVRSLVPAEASAHVERRPGLVCRVEQGGLVRVMTGDGEVLISEAEVDAPRAGAVNLSETEIAEGDLLGV